MASEIIYTRQVHNSGRSILDRLELPAKVANTFRGLRLLRAQTLPSLAAILTL